MRKARHFSASWLEHPCLRAGTTDVERHDETSSGAGRSRGGSRGNRSSLGRNALGDGAFRDHALTAAGTASATTLDHAALDHASLAATAAAAAFDDSGLAARTAAAFDDGSITARTTGSGFATARLASRGGFHFAMATVLRPREQTTVALLGLVPGQETATVATTTAVATMAGNSTRVTANEGDGDEREEHRNCKTHEPLHQIPPLGEPNAWCVLGTVTNSDPIRDGYRTAAHH